MGSFKASVLGSMAVAALVATFAASPRAEAATLNFALTGDFTANWSLDSDPTPTGHEDLSGCDCVYFTGISGISATYLTFYGTDIGGGLRVGANFDPNTEVGTVFDLGFNSAQIFSGTLAAPHFDPGSFTLTDSLVTNTVAHGTLTITVATGPTPTPVPAALPLFMAALGGLGFVGWRRRNSAAKI